MEISAWDWWGHILEFHRLMKITAFSSIQLKWKYLKSVFINRFQMQWVSMRYLHSQYLHLAELIEFTGRWCVTKISIDNIVFSKHILLKCKCFLHDVRRGIHCRVKHARWHATLNGWERFSSDIIEYMCFPFFGNLNWTVESNLNFILLKTRNTDRSGLSTIDWMQLNTVRPIWWHYHFYSRE